MQRLQATREDQEPNVALIVGVTGIVGKALLELLLNPSSPGHPWKVYGVARRPQPAWLLPSAPPATAGGGDTTGSTTTSSSSQASDAFQYIQLDLLDRERTLATLSALEDVTHLFYMTWATADGSFKEEDNIRVNGAMYQNTLDAVVRDAAGGGGTGGGSPGRLQHIVLQTGGKYYTGPFELAMAAADAAATAAGTTTNKSSDDDDDGDTGGGLQLPEVPFRESEPRRAVPNFYYTQADITAAAVRRSADAVTWSEHRPSFILGAAPRSAMNLAATLGAYAALCADAREPLVFPGTPFAWRHELWDASDARLVAEQELWAALDPRAKNQAFNVTNGDVCTWRRLWRALAERYGLEVPQYRPEEHARLRFQDLMRGRGPAWARIAADRGLAPAASRLEDVAQWWFADFATHATAQGVMSVSKSRAFGFLGWRDTEESFVACWDELKRNKILP